MSKGNRSAAYQHLFWERSYSPEYLEDLPNAVFENQFIDNGEILDEIADLKEELRKEYWRLIETLAPVAKNNIKLLAQGYTQIECAKLNGSNQSSIVKSLSGNIQYRNGKRYTSYGGATKRLRALVATDEKCQQLIKRINELTEELY